MNKYKGYLDCEYSFDDIVDIEDMGFGYIVYMTGLKHLTDMLGNTKNYVYSGIRSLQISKISKEENACEQIIYNGIVYNSKNIGKLIMIIKNRQLDKVLEEL